GAFAQTMQGGAVFYTPDITAKRPKWTQVFDDGAAAGKIFPGNDAIGASSNAGWVQTSPDDRFLYRAFTGRRPGTLGKDDPGTTGGVDGLDICKRVDAGTDITSCFGTKAESEIAGQEDDCPTVAAAAPFNPGVSRAG